MSHPMVDGTVMGYGFYDQYCTEDMGYNFDRRTGKPVNPSCSNFTHNLATWKRDIYRRPFNEEASCLYSSLRDINSCRPLPDQRHKTGRIVDGLNVDIMVPPRECLSIDNPSPWHASLHDTVMGDFHGWKMKIPKDTYFVLGPEGDGYGEPSRYMSIPEVAPPNEYTDLSMYAREMITQWEHEPLPVSKPDPDRICPRWDHVIHKQHFLRDVKNNQFTRDDSNRGWDRKVIWQTWKKANDKNTEGQKCKIEITGQCLKYAHMTDKGWFDDRSHGGGNVLYCKSRARSWQQDCGILSHVQYQLTMPVCKIKIIGKCKAYPQLVSDALIKNKPFERGWFSDRDYGGPKNNKMCEYRSRSWKRDCGRQSEVTFNLALQVWYDMI